MVQVFKRDLSIRHYAPFLSLANLFRICAYVAVAVLAFVFAYDSGDLWKKQGTYLEQPKVQLRTEAIMVLTTVATSTGVVSRRIWSTMSDLNNLIPSARLLAGTFRSSQTDSNRDGIVDYINVNVIVPVDTTFTVRGARLATFVNVVLQDKVKMQMNAIAIAEHESTLPGVMFSSAGPLLFQQRTPLITYDDIHVPNGPLTWVCAGQRKSQITRAILQSPMRFRRTAISTLTTGSYRSRSATVRVANPYLAGDTRATVCIDFCCRNGGVLRPSPKVAAGHRQPIPS